MKYLHLIWAALFRRKTRTFLTLVSIMAAFLLFGLLDTVRVAFNPGDDVTGATRLVVTSKVSFTQSLPISLKGRIGQVPGVTGVAWASWFGGYYQDPKNQLPSFAVSDSYLDVYPGLKVTADQLAQWQRTRTGVLVGDKLMQRFGWKVGDQIPLQSGTWPSIASGSHTWDVVISGVMHGTTDDTAGFGMMIFLHWKYYDENNPYEDDVVHWYVAEVGDPLAAGQVAQRIDALSTNSDHETTSQTEQAFQASFLKQLVDIGLIVMSIMGAVFFTLLLLTGNTMMQAVRERTSELAVLKTIGFSDRSILAMVLSESVLLLLLGGVIGLALVAVIVPGLAAASGGMVPIHGVAGRTWLAGIVLMLIIGVLVGLLPALRAMRLNMVDALRADG